MQGGRRGRGAAIDAGYTLADGRAFDGVDQFQELVLAEPKRLARNVAEKLITYGTGAPVALADRDHVETIVNESAAADYGFRSLLHAVVASPIFLTK
jgi:hypothetical protein